MIFVLGKVYLFIYWCVLFIRGVIGGGEGINMYKVFCWYVNFLFWFFLLGCNELVEGRDESDVRFSVVFVIE